MDQRGRQEGCAKSNQREPGFTKFDNYFLDHVMPRVTSVEWKLISAIIRETVGWHRKDSEISIDRFMALTGVARQAVVAGIKRACARSVVKRRAKQLGRQRSFLYSAVPRANLKSVPKLDPRRHQTAFSFATECENQTPSASVKIKLPSLVSQFENQTPTAAVVRLRKKDQDLKTHTQPPAAESNKDNNPRVCGSRFTLLQIRQYAWASYHFDQLLRARGERVDGIRNPDGWAISAYRSGEYDPLIQEWLDNPGMFNLASGY